MSDNIYSIKRTGPGRQRSAAGRLLGLAGRLLVLVLVLLLLGGAGLLLFRISDEARSVFQFIVRYSVFAYVVHLALTVWLWLGWERLVAVLVSRGLVPEHVRIDLLKRKNRWCAVLLTLQLMLLASAFVQPA